MSLGDNIKKLRVQNKLTQAELGEKLFVSDKTISSWESNRTYPDIEALADLCGALNTNILFLTNGSNKTETELEIKVRVTEEEQKRIFDIIKKDGKLLREEEQKATYFKSTLRDMNKEWLRIRREDKHIVLNYKKKTDDVVKEYEVNIDNEENLKKIFGYLDFVEAGNVNKYRVAYLYKDKYEVSFDDVENLGLFIEFELKRYDKDYINEYEDLIKLLYELNININDIEKRRYPEMIMQKNK